MLPHIRYWRVLLMKGNAKNKIAPKWLRYSSYSMSTIALFATLIYILTNHQNWLIVIALTWWSILLTISFILIQIENQKPKLTHVCFDDTFVSVCLGKIVLKRIPYEKIMGATILRAMSHIYLHPYLDLQNKERGVLTLYQSDCSFLYGLKSKSGIVCHGSNPNVLCYDLAYTEHLPILLKKTKVCIYVTEQMLALHKDLLTQTLQRNPDRIFVACFDKAIHEERIMPYNEYVLYCQ